MIEERDYFEDIQEEIEDEPIKVVEEEVEEKKAGIDWIGEIKDLFVTFIICFVMVWGLTNFVVKPVQVDGASMYPTLVDKEVGMVNLMLVNLDGVSRYDVVVIHHQERDENWVKRIIGLPGETISCKDDVVYINGQPLDEPYLDTDYVNDYRRSGAHFTNDFDEVTLKEGEYFLMGDNRVVSLDSRIEGPFKEEDIIGKDVYIFYPFEQFKIVRNNY